MPTTSKARKDRRKAALLPTPNGQVNTTVLDTKAAASNDVSTSTVDKAGGGTAGQEPKRTAFSSSRKKRKGKSGKKQEKQQEDNATKEEKESGDNDADEKSSTVANAPDPNQSAKSTASLIDLDPDAFMAGLADAGLGDDGTDDEDASGDNSGEDNDGEDEEDSADSGDEDANAAAMDLNKLAETDPEFYTFLKQEEPTLLDFDPMEDDGDYSADEGGGQVPEGDAAAGGEKGTSSKPQDPAALLRAASRGGGVTLTMPLLKAMRQEAFEQKSIKGVRRMIKSFRCGCHLGDEAEDDKSGGAQKFRIPSSEVYNELMVSALDGLHPVLMGLLFPDRREPATANIKESTSANANRKRGRTEGGDREPESEAADRHVKKKKRMKKGVNKPSSDASTAMAKAPGAQKTIQEGGLGGVKGGEVGEASRRSKALILTKEEFRAAAQLPVWKAVQPALYSFFKSLLHVLGELKDRALLAFLLSRLEHYIPLLVPFPGLARAYLKALLELWGGTGAEAKSSGGGSKEDGEEAERVRLLAYLRVRQMAAALPFPFVEGCMKGLYLAFATRARAPPSSTAAKISLRVMEGCVVELFSMDVASAYQNAFLYIRQLSLLLRRSMQQKSKDAFQAVRRWQVLSCLRVWTGVLAAAPAEDELRMLIFPLAQVIEGIIRLCATLRHSPFAFQLVRMRQRLAAAAGLYVPSSSPLLAVLRSPALSKKATASTDAPPNVPAILRLGKNQVGEGRAQGAVVAEALRLLNQEMDLYRYSAAFPELVVPVLGHLRKFARATKVSKWRMMARGLMETLESRGTWAAKRRMELKRSPTEAEGLEALRPESAPTMRKRLGASEAEVERIDDEATTVPAGLAIPHGKTSRGKDESLSANGGKQDNDQSESDSEMDQSEHDSDADDLGMLSSRRDKTKGKGARTTSLLAKRVLDEDVADCQDEDIGSPDMVEDLGAWSDDEEW